MLESTTERSINQDYARLSESIEFDPIRHCVKSAHSSYILRTASNPKMVVNSILFEDWIANEIPPDQHRFHGLLAVPATQQ